MSSYLHTATIGKPHGIKGAVSIITTLNPQEEIFVHPLYIKIDGLFHPFEVTSFEAHHQKIICFSPTILDRNEAERQVGTLLYCERNDFFNKTPDQINGELCHGYQIIDGTGFSLGTLDYVQLIHDIPMGYIRNGQQNLNLPMQIRTIDHKSRIIQLDYNL